MATARRTVVKANDSGLLAKEPNHKKNKQSDDKDALISRVKKVIKKSRRQLTEEKFEKQLRRTIVFLDELQSKLTATKRSVNEVQKRQQVRTVKKTKPKSSGRKEQVSRG